MSAASCLLAYYNADSDEEEEFDMEDFDSYAGAPPYATTVCLGSHV